VRPSKSHRKSFWTSALQGVEERGGEEEEEEVVGRYREEGMAVVAPTAGSAEASDLVATGANRLFLWLFLLSSVMASFIVLSS
jgi:hypothetical protein